MKLYVSENFLANELKVCLKRFIAFFFGEAVVVEMLEYVMIYLKL